jgi:hypothetical protein
MRRGGEYETLETHATVNALVFAPSIVLTTVTPLMSFCCASVISGPAGILTASFRRNTQAMKLRQLKKLYALRKGRNMLFVMNAGVFAHYGIKGLIMRQDAV